MAKGRLLLFSFLFSLPQAQSVMSHGGGEWVKPRDNISATSDNDWDARPPVDFQSPTLTKLAETATESLTNDTCDSSSEPAGTVKCAFQATKIIEKAKDKIPESGFSNFDSPLNGFIGSDAVVGVVDELVGKGWKASEGPCPARIPGSVVFTNPEYTTTDRSHIGIVGSKGEIIHNKGEDGSKGCLVSSDSNDGAFFSSQPEWYNNVRCLIPPDANFGAI